MLRDVIVGGVSFATCRLFHLIRRERRYSSIVSCCTRVGVLFGSFISISSSMALLRHHWMVLLVVLIAGSRILFRSIGMIGTFRHDSLCHFGRIGRFFWFCRSSIVLLFLLLSLFIRCCNCHCDCWTWTKASRRSIQSLTRDERRSTGFMRISGRHENKVNTIYKYCTGRNMVV